MRSVAYARVVTGLEEESGIMESVKGKCVRCGHSRVAPDSSFCFLCLHRVRMRMLQDAIRRYCKYRGLWDEPMHVCADRSRSLVEPVRSLVSLKPADLGRDTLRCCLCGGEHARVDCSWDRPSSFSPVSSGKQRNNSTILVGKIKDEAHAYWVFLREHGWVD